MPERGIRISGGMIMAIVGLLISLGGRLVALGRMIEQKADRAEVAEVQKALAEIKVDVAAMGGDTKWTVAALERLEHRIEGSTTRPVGPGWAAP